MSSNATNRDALSIPVAILIGSVIISGSIIYASRSQPAAKVVQNVPAQQQAIALDVKNISLANDPIVGASTAPVAVAYWFDYQCPFCKQNEQNNMQKIMAEYVDTGKIRVVFKDLQFLGADSTSIGLAARAVWELAPAKFYAWHKALFENQGRENTGWATKDVIRKITAGVLGDALTDQVMNLMVSKAAVYQKLLDADKAQGSALGITSTPSMVIGTSLVRGAQGYDQVKAAIDAALKARK